MFQLMDEEGKREKPVAFKISVQLHDELLRMSVEYDRTIGEQIISLVKEGIKARNAEKTVQQELQELKAELHDMREAMKWKTPPNFQQGGTSQN